MNQPMIVECQHCHTRLRMDPSKISPTGSKVKCAKCQNIFKVFPNASTEGVPSKTTAAPEANSPTSAEPGTTPAPPPEEPAKSDGDMSQFESFFSDEQLKTATVPSPDLPKTEPSTTNKTTEKAFADEIAAAAKKEASSKKASPPKLQLTNRGQPIITGSLSPKQRAFRALVVLGIALSGFLLGITAIGAIPTPRSFYLLFKYGIRNIASGPQLLRYEGHLWNVETGNRRLGVTGELLDVSDSKGPVRLKMEIFTPSGEFLGQFEGTCCERGLKSYEVTPFDLEMDLPAGSVGRYKVAIEK